MRTTELHNSLLRIGGGFAQRQGGRRPALVLPLMLALVLAFNVASEAQNLAWAKRAGGLDDDTARDLAVDAAANSFVTGHFENSAVFGAGEANETTLSSTGISDFFIAKYNRDGALLWAKPAGGSGSHADGFAIALDGAGNSYVTGSFYGSATFGAGETNQITFSSTGENDIFMAKYNANGSLAWAKRAGGSLGDQGRGLAVDAAGNTYVTGSFGYDNSSTPSSATFGLGEANETTLSGTGQDIFVAKYNGSGALLWAKSAGGASGSPFESGAGIAVDGFGNSYVTGSFEAHATFGPGEANETTLSGDFAEIFVAKYFPSGELIWAKRAGGPVGDRGQGIAVDDEGNSYLTGNFEQSVTFGPGEAGAITLPGSTLGDDVFVAKYNSAGTPVWAKATSDGLEHGGHDLALDPAGNVHVTGTVLVSAIFGLGEANETTLSGNSRLVFVAKYDGDNGALIWVKGADGEAFKDDVGNGIGVDGAGNSYVTGFFESSAATFGLGEANETTLSSAGDEDLFVAKFSASISDVVNDADDMIDDVLAGGGLDSDAVDALNDAQEDLQDAQDALAAGDIATFYEELGDAAANLEDAEDEDAEVTDILELLLALARQTAEDARALAVACPDPDKKNRRARKIADGDGNVAEAEEEYAGGDYNDAIDEYGEAWEDYQAAIDRCPSYMPKLAEEAGEQSPVSGYQLTQNYPNPFNPSTMISFQLPAVSEVSLAIYNSAGQLVRTLVAGEKPAGRYSVLWDGKNEAGVRVASGVYVYRLQAGEFVARRKLVFMK